MKPVRLTGYPFKTSTNLATKRSPAYLPISAVSKSSVNVVLLTSRSLKYTYLKDEPISWPSAVLLEWYMRSRTILSTDGWRSIVPGGNNMVSIDRWIILNCRMSHVPLPNWSLRLENITSILQSQLNCFANICWLANTQIQEEQRMCWTSQCEASFHIVVWTHTPYCLDGETISCCQVPGFPWMR